MSEMRQPASGAAAFRVLIIDDDRDMAEVLSMMLDGEGLAVDIAIEGAQARALIARVPPDLVLCDVMLPDESGFDFCRRFKQDENTAMIPLVLVTALDDSESRLRGIEAGADDFLSKPVKRLELVARIRMLRRLHETRKALERRKLEAEKATTESVRRAFRSYLSPNLADRVLNGSATGEDLFRDLSDRSAVVALFADLRGFTRLSESVPVSRIVPMLNEYFTILTAAAHENEGTVFSMAGDSLLVGFNVPLPQPDAAERALRAARTMIARFHPLAQTWRHRHGVPVGIGIGIEAGEVVVGNVGSPTFMSYTIIGDTVNTAARLMQIANPGEIIIGPGAWLALRPLLGGGLDRYRRPVNLKGKAAPVDVLKVRIDPSEVPA